MPDDRDELAAIVHAIAPFDATEATHKAETLEWIASGAPIHRTQKPDVPAEHLVVYFAVVDADANSTLLVDHRNAQLWLPNGGHVEVNEHPNDAVVRELDEELGLAAEPLGATGSQPLFVSRTRTVGLDGGHVDVSLWYALKGTTDATLRPDESEFRAVRWWPFSDVHTADPATLDPCLPRFVRKLERTLAHHRSG